MPLPPRFLEELNSKISLAQVVGKKVKLTKRGREYIGLCPFHHEKTPSFSVSEEKGFYHCFGCGAHGDAIRFVMETERRSFPDVLEQLCRSVGMEPPRSTPEQQAMAKRQMSLYKIMEKACSFYQEQLFKTVGEKALSYLKKRRLEAQTIETFRLGYAPGGNLLRTYLLREGCDEQDLIALGLVCKSTEAGRDNYDYFRDRVVFPIQDRRGHIIGFGGRVMGEGEPKYLNSPETTLFHKGENVYGLYVSADEIIKKEQVILVEGYMDVIALHQAGIKNAVAPLGTALTEHQIELLWQKAPEPVICFDGDNAGRRAATRACERVLPILKAGHSLKFLWLPDGVDPDEFVGAFGRDSFEHQLTQTQSLCDVIWDEMTKGKRFETPEKLALLEKDAKEKVARIKDETIRSYYEREFRKKIKELTQRRFSVGGKKQEENTTKKSLPLPSLSPKQAEIKMLLAYIIYYPEIGLRFLEALTVLPVENKKIERLMEILTTEITEDVSLTREDFRKLLETKYSKNIFVYLSHEMEMLERAQKPSEKAKDEMQMRLNALHLANIDDDIKALMEEFKETQSAEIWTSVLSLKQEKEKLTEKMQK